MIIPDSLIDTAQIETRPAAVWLDVGAPVFGVYHPPATTPRSLAVLFCSQFGWEEMGSYPARRQWALALAAAGHPVLRFDLPGTGQSAGGPADDGLVARWLQATDGAARWLRARSGCETLAAVGISLGALLGLRAAAEGAPIDELVLWGLPGSGRTLVRRMRAFAALQSSRSADAPAPESDGWLETGGFTLSPQTLVDLSSLRVTGPPDPRLRRALLLRGDTSGGESATAEVLRTGGVAVDIEDGPGYAEIHDSPHLTHMPRETVARSLAWLAAGEVEAPAPASPAASPPPPAEDHLRIMYEGTALIERAFEVPTPEGTMFGILTEPAEPAAEVPEAALVCLSAMAERSIGPSRLWVECARRHAARGLPTLRFDLLSIGDSDGDPGVMGNFGTIYDRRRAAQVRAVLDALAARTPARRFALAGLCSGGYWAMGAAWRDPRVLRLLVLNPSISPAERSAILRGAIRRPVRMLLQPEILRRARERGVDVLVRAMRREATHVLLRNRGDRPEVALASPGVEPPGEPDVDRAPSYRALGEALARRGGRMSVGMGELEPAFWLLKLEGLVRAPNEPSGPHVTVIPSVDHNLRPCPEQRVVLRLVDELVAGLDAAR